MKIKTDFINIESISCGRSVAFIFDKNRNSINEIHKYNVTMGLIIKSLISRAYKSNYFST